MSTATRVVALLGVPLCAACTTAVWSDARIESGQRAAIARADLAPALADKAAVLARLGPPGEVLAPGGGDIFVYRELRVDEGLLQLNAALFAGPAMPILADFSRCARSDVLFVFFDTDGRVVQAAHRHVTEGPCAEDVP